MRIATLNVQNLRLRGSHLDGARDGDVPGDTGPGARAIDWIDRRLTAALIRDANADLLVLQEVFDAETLEYFHTRYLTPLGATYPIRHCLPGNDGRGLDLALLSRQPLTQITSHASLTPQDAGVDPALGLDPDLPVFRRDCLEIDTGDLTLYACHFKAPYPDEETAWATRRAEAQSVRHLIETRFANPATARWLILGDLNDPRDAPSGRKRAITPLLPPFSESLVDRLPNDRRWSYHQPQGHLYSAPDKLLASPALAADNPDALPRILRHGMGHETTRYTGPRLPGTGDHRPHASDHAAIVIELSIL